MDFLKITLGLLALLLAWVFLFRTGLIFRLNTWVRAHIFNDEIILFSRRRMAILMMVLAAVALFSGIDGLVDEQPLKPRIAADMLERAREDYNRKRYKSVLKRCKHLVRANPKNVKAWKLLAATWWTLGEKKQAIQAFKSVKQLDPTDPFEDLPTLKLIEKEVRLAS